MQFSCPGPLLYFGGQESGVADLISQITEDQTRKKLGLLFSWGGLHHAEILGSEVPTTAG